MYLAKSRPVLGVKQAKEEEDGWLWVDVIVGVAQVMVG